MESVEASRGKAASRLFSRSYDTVCYSASNLWCDGLTSYQAALGDVLGAFEDASRLGLVGGKHVVSST